MLWVTPVTLGSNGWFLKKERIGYTEEIFQPIYESLRAVHPRLLPLVKAAILPDEPDATDDERPFCGTAADFELAEQGDIAFDGQAWLLSHCGERFFDSLLPPSEVLPLLHKVENSLAVEVLTFMEHWLKSGFHVILIKE